MSYKSTRRQWVKLWVNEWLDGTTRFELTAAQRLLWVDLLALAGRSRFPGFIYAGTGQGNEKVGYPIAYLAGVLQMDETDTNNALKLLEAHGHITLEEVSPEKYIIGIINWEKYQSEYLRQKTYRKVTTKTTSRLPVEGEGDVEGDVKSSTIDDLKGCLLAECKDPHGTIAAIVEIVCERAAKSGVKIRTEAYLQKAVESFDTMGGQDREELQRRMILAK